MSTTRSTKARRKRLAAVYREAASLIESGSGEYYACDAIGRVVGSYLEDEPEVVYFSNYFRQPWKNSVGGWWDSSDWSLWDEDRGFLPSQTPRVIALLLMAELAEDGQLD